MKAASIDQPGSPEQIRYGDLPMPIIVNFKLAVILLGLLVLVLYHTFYRSSAEVTKLSLTVALTISWLVLTFFYPYLPQQGTDVEYEAGILCGGAVGFFDLIGGLAVCVLWIHFFCDEVSLK